jgi:hypothetical protein
MSLRKVSSDEGTAPLHWVYSCDAAGRVTTSVVQPPNTGFTRTAERVYGGCDTDYGFVSQ